MSEQVPDAKHRKIVRYPDGDVQVNIDANNNGKFSDSQDIGLLWKRDGTQYILQGGCYKTITNSPPGIFATSSEPVTEAVLGNLAVTVAKTFCPKPPRVK